ncbi:MAG: four-carbon acid sugar kinase family protein [Lacunisphaera sp.]
MGTESRTKVIVLDDDPTGTQTVHDVDVLTEWSTASLVAAFNNPEWCVFILTNSRALAEPAAVALTQEIVRNVQLASRIAGRPFALISRSDSTLRGHFPAEVDAMRDAFDGTVDGVCLVPAFFEAGRFTVGGTHFLREAGELIPVAETEFARDATFGYRTSYLPAWVEEKSRGAIPASAVTVITLETIRGAHARGVFDRLLALPQGGIVAVDAECYADLEVLVHAVLLAEQAGRRLLFRTAASFVRVRAGLAAREYLRPEEMIRADQKGGVIVVGSYVAKTTAQLRQAQALSNVRSIELSVQQVLDPATREAALAAAAAEMEQALARHEHALVYTSRELATAAGRAGELSIGRRISEALVDLVGRLRLRPRFLIAKGGITSSDLAVKALGVRRARVLGQAAPGIPVWQLGTESRFPGMAYIVFPGNVGGELTLAELIGSLAPDRQFARHDA